MIRNTIARETTSHKLSILRSQKDILKTKLEQIKEDASDNNNIDHLKIKAEAVLTLQVTDCDKAKSVAKDALLFVREQTVLRSISSEHVKSIRHWHQRIEDELALVMNRSEHAVLFCDVLQEWLDHEGSKAEKQETMKTVVSVDGLVEHSPPQTKDFKVWDPKEYLISKGVSDNTMLHLQKLAEDASEFGNSISPQIVVSTSDTDVKSIGNELLTRPIRTKTIQSAMERLARDPALQSVDVRKQILDESQKPMVLEELSSALTETMRTIQNWKWPENGVKRILQTHINGKERLFLRIDIVYAIFLQCIGDSWAGFYYDALQELVSSDEEDVESKGPPFEIESELAAISPVNPKQTQYQLYIAAGNSSLTALQMQEGIKQSSKHSLIHSSKTQSLEQFVALLKPTDSGDYNGAFEDQSANDRRSNRLRRNRSNESTNSWDSCIIASKTAKTYDTIFQRITTKIQFVQTVDPEAQLTFLHGDIQNFGNSVSHDVAIAVMKFFGMPPLWISWLKTYLKIPIQLEDGLVEFQMVGTPFGQLMSTIINELLLVLLDFAIITKTKQIPWRYHDDYWLAGINTKNSQVDVVGESWALMQDFATQVGLVWNENKCGSTIVQSSIRGGNNNDDVKMSVETDTKSLPVEPLRWGVLVLDETGKWQINNEAVEMQVVKASEEYRNAKSFLHKVNVINKYTAFLVRNCGKILNSISTFVQH